MAAPNAPMPLKFQIQAGANIVVTVPLRQIGPAPNFVDGAGGGFNAGNPTATYTIAIPAATFGPPGTPTGAMPGTTDEAILDILDQLDNLAQKQTATIT